MREIFGKLVIPVTAPKALTGRQLGLTDEQLTELRTPAELLLLINDQLAPAAGI